MGSGPAESSLKELFRGTRTLFTGYMGGTDLAKAYASSDDFAFPSDTETLGFVALEAMASGVPVVGARAGGIPDVIQHGEHGLLFSPGNLDNLRNQLKLLLGNIHLRNKLGSQARIDTEAWSWEKSTLKLLDSYNLAKAVRRRFDPPSAL